MIYSRFRTVSRALFVLSGVAFVLVAPARATSGGSSPIPVDHYTYLDSPDYADSGGELTDGIIPTTSWGGAGFGSEAEQYVGFYAFHDGPESGDGLIRFDFGTSVTLTAVTLCFGDSNGAAGVYFPTEIWLNTPSFDFFQIFSVSDPIGFGTSASVTLSGFEVQTSVLNVRVSRVNGHDWHMLGEVSFAGPGSAIPEPSTYAAVIGVAALGFVTWRRRRGGDRDIVATSDV